MKMVSGRNPHPGLEAVNHRGPLVTLLGHPQRWGAHFLPRRSVPLSDHIYCEKTHLTSSLAWPPCALPTPLTSYFWSCSVLWDPIDPFHPLAGQPPGNLKGEDPFLQ